MSKKLSDPTIPELSDIADNARIYVLLMDEPEGSRDRYINLSVVAASSNGPSGNASGNVTSHGSTTVNVLTVYASTDGTKIKSTGIDYNDLVLTADLADYVTDAELSAELANYVTSTDLNDYITSSELTTALGPYATISFALGYANSAANISNSVAVAIGVSSNGWTNASITTTFEYANSKANIANSVAVTIGTAGNLFSTSIGASSNAWTNTSIATLPSIYASHINLTANMATLPSIFVSHANLTSNLSLYVTKNNGTFYTHTTFVAGTEGAPSIHGPWANSGLSFSGSQTRLSSNGRYVYYIDDNNTYIINDVLLIIGRTGDHGSPRFIIRNEDHATQNGAGPFFTMESYNEANTLFNAIDMNGGLQVATVGSESSCLDIGGYRDGVYEVIWSISPMESFIGPGWSDNVYDNAKYGFRWRNIYTSNVRPGNGSVLWTSGDYSPESNVTANVGSIYTRTDGGIDSTLYIKESGNGNTGWVVKTDLTRFASHANLTSNIVVMYGYANSTANIANSVAISIGAAANSWTNTSLATLPAIYASHVNLTANMVTMYGYANSKANIANSVAVTIGTAGNTYAAVVGTAGNLFSTSIGAAANGWTNTSIATVTTTAFVYANLKANIANSVAVVIGTAGNTFATAIGASSNAWTNTSLATLPTIYSSHANVTANVTALSISIAQNVASMFNIATMNLDNINESSSNIHFKPGYLSNLRNVMNGNGGSIPATISNLASLGVSAVNAFIYSTGAGTWGYADSATYRTLMGAMGDLRYAQGFELNQLGSGDRYAIIDMHAQDGVDYSSRIIREPGANANFTFVNQGYGFIDFSTNTGVRINGSKVWYDGNDGSTSGLDADLLDGIHLSEFMVHDNLVANAANVFAVVQGDISNTFSISIGAAANGWTNTSLATGLAAANGWTNASVSGIDNTVQTINEITANTYVLVLSDKGKLVASNVTIAGANANVQIPNFGNTAFANGTRIDIAKWGNTNTRITTSNGIILNGNIHATLEFDGRYVAAGIHMQKANVWHAYGPLSRIELSDLRQINATNSSTSTVTIPSDTQFGDLIFFYDYGVNGSGTPTNTVEDNFIPIVSRVYSTTTRLSLSMKIAEEGDAGTSINGFDGDTTNRHIIVVFRGNVPLSNAYIGTSSNVAASDADQAQQLQNVVPQGIVFAAYRSSGAVAPRTFNLTSNGEHRATTSEYVKWHTANTATANAIIDMDDEGNGNFLFSGTIICR